jgi:hypothetical protein
MLDVKLATLEELEAESRRLSGEIERLKEERRPVDDEMSRRHDIFRALRSGTPHEIDAALRAGEITDAQGGVP